MDVKRIRIKKKLYTVTNIKDYLDHPDIYNPSYTAIECGDIVLPVIPQSHIKYEVGIAPVDRLMNEVHYPNDDEVWEYNVDNIKDYLKPKDVKSLMAMQQSVRELERDILTDVDNIYTPIIGDDTPEMKALKTAIIQKHIDLDKYAYKFGSNFGNEKRVLMGNTITLKKLKKFADALDMKCTLTISDAAPNVPNPMVTPIEIEITGGANYEDDEDD